MNRPVLYFLLILLLTIPFRLSGQKKDILLDEVVVTGTGTRHLVKNAPVRTEVLERKEIEALGGSSVEEILSQLSASIDFNPNDMGSNIQMGGLGNEYILILVDGRRMNGDLGGQNNLGAIDPARIQKIEIVKGAASALYGSDAIAGVINIITKKDIEDLLVENTTRYGSYNDVRQSDRIVFRVGKVASSTNFQLKHNDGWQNTTCENPNRYEEPVTNSINKTTNEFTDWQIAERLDIKAAGNVDLYADGNFYHKRIFRPCGIPDYRTYDFIYRDWSAAAGGKALILEDDRITWDLTYDSHGYFYAYTKETWQTETDENGNAYTFPFFPGDISLQSRQDRFMAQGKGIFDLPFQNRLSAGLEYRLDLLKAPYRLDEPQVYENAGALYAQDEWTPARWFSLTAGVRMNWYQSFGFRVTPKASLLFKAGPVNIRVDYSEGFKAPTLKELHYRYIRQMSLITLNLGNENLKPQTSRYISLGGEFYWKGFSIDISGYYNRLRNMITLVTVPVSEAPGDLVVLYDPARVRIYKNMDEAYTCGADLNVRWKPARWLSLSGSYSYLDTHARLYNDEEKEMEEVTIDGTAHHRGVLSAAWNHEWKNQGYRLDIAVFGRLQSERYYQDDGNGKAYNLWRINTGHQVDLRGGWFIDIDAGIDNIFNYRETTYHGLHYGTKTPGRTYYVSLKFRFTGIKKS